jgi:hypothetical protein
MLPRGTPRGGVGRSPEDFVIEHDDEFILTEEVRIPAVRSIEVRLDCLEFTVEFFGWDTYEQKRPLDTVLRGDDRRSQRGILQALPHDNPQVVAHCHPSQVLLHQPRVCEMGFRNLRVFGLAQKSAIRSALEIGKPDGVEEPQHVPPDRAMGKRGERV